MYRSGLSQKKSLTLPTLHFSLFPVLYAGGSFDVLGVTSVWPLPLNTFDSHTTDDLPVTPV